MELVRPDTLEEASGALGDGSVVLAGGTEVVPQLRDGILDAETLVDVRGVLPHELEPGRIGAGTTLAALEQHMELPEVLREACRLAASPQLRNMGTIGGNLLQSTRCWYWRLQHPCRLHGGDRCFAHDGEHREHAIFANGFCASAHPSDPAAALLALDATIETTRAAYPLGELYRVPDADDRRAVALDPGELIVSIRYESPDRSVYLKAMDRQRWSFPLVGVAAARFGDRARVALSGVAPVPWLLAGPQALEEATPLPGTAFKLEIARALVSRALSAVA